MNKINRLIQLLQRKNGATSMEIVAAIGTVSPHSRLSDLKKKGYTILKKPIPGKTYHRYYITKGK